MPKAHLLDSVSLHFIGTILPKAQLLDTLPEIYFGGDKCRNFDHFAHLVPKIISAENYLRRIFISAEYLSPPNIYLRRIYISAEYLSPPKFFPIFHSVAL